MSYIKLIRLKNHDDIVSFATEDKGAIKLTHPVSVYISYNTKEDREELVMQNWLPKPIITKNEALIPKSEILCVLEPTKHFKEYYLNFLNDYQSVEELTVKEEISDLITSLDAKADNKLH